MDRGACLQSRGLPFHSPGDLPHPGIEPTSPALAGRFFATEPEWVAVPFSRGSSQPRDQTQVSHIAGGFFTTESPRKGQSVQKPRKGKNTRWGLQVTDKVHHLPSSEVLTHSCQLD